MKEKLEPSHGAIPRPELSQVQTYRAPRPVASPEPSRTHLLGQAAAVLRLLVHRLSPFQTQNSSFITIALSALFARCSARSPQDMDVKFYFYIETIASFGTKAAIRLDFTSALYTAVITHPSPTLVTVLA
eukprot:IDg11921t1